MVVPVLRDRDDNVVAGHGRVMAARKAGITKIPTILIDHLSLAQLRAFAIADNKLHDLSDWDEVMLAEELKTLSAMDLDFSLEATGFEVAEIDTLILGAQGPMCEGDDEVLPPIGPAVSRPGDLWQLVAHRILCGNALEAASYERLLQGKTADAVVSDAPYGVAIAGHVSTRRGAKQHREFLMGGGGMSAQELRAFFAKSFQQLRAPTKPGALIYASIDWRHAAVMQAAAEEAGLELSPAPSRRRASQQCRAWAARTQPPQRLALSDRERLRPGRWGRRSPGAASDAEAGSARRRRHPRRDGARRGRPRQLPWQRQHHHRRGADGARRLRYQHPRRAPPHMRRIDQA